MTKTQAKSIKRREKPLVIGTGLVALDIVISKVSKAPVRYWAGGTCGNVLTALSYLGWRAQPVARLGVNPATNVVCDDLKRWKVSTRYVRTEQDGTTPIIVERIKKDASGAIRHTFSWRCTGCGIPYPGYRPELLTVSEKISAKLANPKVFFFDRVSAGALALAKACTAKGGLVVFEPSGIGNPLQFRQAWEAAHIVKYSHERLTELPEMEFSMSPHLQIETLGDSGLRYRRAHVTAGHTAWTELKAFSVEQPKDSAGAGDWCTAGLISKIGDRGLKGFLRTEDSTLNDALRFGQALAAWNCQFEGARGGMYSVTRQVFAKQVRAILTGTSHADTFQERTQSVETDELKGLCSACEGPSKTKAKSTRRRA